MKLTQGMRDAKIIIGTTGLSENLGQDDGSGKHDWGLHDAPEGTLIAFRAVSGSFHPGGGGGGGPTPISFKRGRAAEHDTSFLAALAPKKVFITIPPLFYSSLPITRTLADSNLALTRTKIDFPWTSFIHLL